MAASIGLHHAFAEGTLSVHRDSLMQVLKLEEIEGKSTEEISEIWMKACV